MKYPVDPKKVISQFERTHGPASELDIDFLTIYTKCLNKAYRAGIEDGKKVGVTA